MEFDQSYEFQGNYKEALDFESSLRYMGLNKAISELICLLLFAVLWQY